MVESSKQWLFEVGFKHAGSRGNTERNYCDIYYVKLPNCTRTVKKIQETIISCLDKNYEEFSLERKVGSNNNLPGWFTTASLPVTCTLLTLFYGLGSIASGMNTFTTDLRCHYPDY